MEINEKEIIKEGAGPFEEEKAPENEALPKQKKKIRELLLPVQEFVKKHKIPIIYIAIISAIVIAIICMILAILALNRAKLATDFLEGKVYAEKDIYSSFASNTYYSFLNGKLSEEMHHIDDNEPEKNRVEGSLDDYKYFYKIVTYLFNNKISIYVSTDKKDWDFYRQKIFKKDSSGDYFIDTRWEETTPEKVQEARNDILCDHIFDETVISTATCEKAGEVYKICTKCGTEKTEHPTVSHNYEYGKCTECGKSEPKRRAGIDADEWYSYTPVDGMIVKNCLIESASEAAGGAVVWIDPVCAHCHCVIGNLAATHRLVGVSQLNVWSKSFLCYDCNRYTKVEIAFNFGY